VGRFFRLQIRLSKQHGKHFSWQYAAKRGNDFRGRLRIHFSSTNRLRKALGDLTATMNSSEGAAVQSNHHFETEDEKSRFLRKQTGKALRRAIASYFGRKDLTTAHLIEKNPRLEGVRKILFLPVHHIASAVNHLLNASTGINVWQETTDKRLRWVEKKLAKLISPQPSLRLVSARERFTTKPWRLVNMPVDNSDCNPER
jgi:hypothetical protein